MDGINLTVSELIELQTQLSSTIKHISPLKTYISGERRSHIKGRGIDFEEVREYQMGDDVRTIDWKISARVQKTYTRVYKEEKERPILLCVNLSASMRFASKRAFKSIIAAHFATLIAWFANHNKDKVGGVIYAGNTHLECRPSGGKKGIQRLIKGLCKIHQNQDNQNNQDDTNDENQLANSLKRLHKSMRPGSLAIIISDFQHFDKKERNLCRQIAKYNDLMFIFVYDNIEKHPPKANRYLISNGEQSNAQYKTLDTRNKTTRAQYEAYFANRFDKVHQLSQQLNAYFMSIDTEDDLLKKLTHEFAAFAK